MQTDQISEEEREFLELIERLFAEFDDATFDG
jgi:hypothetical protein